MNMVLIAIAIHMFDKSPRIIRFKRKDGVTQTNQNKNRVAFVIFCRRKIQETTVK